MVSLEKTVVRAGSRGDGIELNKVLKNTYLLLAMTLLFSGLMTGVAMVLNVPYLGLAITLGGMIGLLMLTVKTRNSPLGLVSLFAFTGFMGFTLGPIVQFYLSALSNGPQVVMTALGGTGAIFVCLSVYVLKTKKDFTFIGGMLFVGILVAFFAGLAAAVFAIPTLSLAVAVMFVLLMSGLILYQTGQIINGGETNYIMATLTLYMSIYNLFTSLLHLFGIFGGDD